MAQILSSLILASLDGPNRQSPIASVQRTQSTLAGHSASPRGMNTTPTNANRAIRIAVQRTQGLRGPNSVFLEGERRSHLEQWSSACGWPIWLKGQSAQKD